MIHAQLFFRILLSEERNEMGQKFTKERTDPTGGSDAAMALAELIWKSTGLTHLPSFILLLVILRFRFDSRLRSPFFNDIYRSGEIEIEFIYKSKSFSVMNKPWIQDIVDHSEIASLRRLSRSSRELTAVGARITLSY